MRHTFCSSCTNGNCTLVHGCQNKECALCKESGKTLTTHCPGEELDVHRRDLVSKGLLDYRAGKWREGYESRRLYSDPEEAIEIETTYLEDLTDEDATKEHLMEAVSVLKSWRANRHLRR